MKALSEKQIHESVIAHWRALGLPGTRLATIPNMRAAGQAGLTKGLPDLIVMGGEFLRDRTGFIELKTDKGRLSPEQDAFRLSCIRDGVPYACTRGRDEPIRVLEEWQIVRSAA
jgi:hypothetical protein